MCRYCTITYCPPLLPSPSSSIPVSQSLALCFYSLHPSRSLVFALSVILALFPSIFPTHTGNNLTQKTTMFDFLWRLFNTASIIFCHKGLGLCLPALRSVLWVSLTPVTCLELYYKAEEWGVWWNNAKSGVGINKAFIEPAGGFNRLTSNRNHKHVEEYLYVYGSLSTWSFPSNHVK